MPHDIRFGWSLGLWRRHLGLDNVLVVTVVHNLSATYVSS